MPYLIRACVRCGVNSIQQKMVGASRLGYDKWEVAAACNDCSKISVYYLEMSNGQLKPADFGDGNLDSSTTRIGRQPVRIATTAAILSEYIPDRIAGLFREANECRQMAWYEAAGAMCRKTLDVATKHIYAHDERLAGKEPALALRVRIKSMGDMKILEQDIVELADVAALDGNDATHDVDPYTQEEAEALEDLTFDLLDRLFVRPAKIAAVKAKQIAAGVRKA